jgi:hypothetical protein
MKNFSNIEKSAFHKGEYVGYGKGKIYVIVKAQAKGYWFARNRYDGKDQFLTFGLESMSQKLQQKGATT